MLLSLPNELLQIIALEADERSRKRLRRTCKILSDLCTPPVFRSVKMYISWDGRWTPLALLFLTALSSGLELARHIKHLSGFLSESKELNDAASSSISDARTRKREEDVKLFNRLFVDAILLMMSLQLLSLERLEDDGRWNG
ncbi:uncharacterized protein BT62DRAFT_472338 [Guyanagaster necrorhizus]|uniref:F-box domain-containing protein n=1 Tax=Guyanagaster necrorhizus TaxID=856835 RepID=A0A9P8AMY6_9AGAR|nr:uncharacterized protein BT62DRAFT_472338 [Guyanagaster necrorhizus MCA 3950]KAG7441738.1 hypothetical protein BT62DRAFT_472338 [Guyanagaster necrorhizus MCA 3950]